MNNNNKEQNTLDNKVSQNNEIEQVVREESVSEISAVLDSRDERILCLEDELIQSKQREYDNLLRFKAEIENLRRRNLQEIEKTHKFILEKFVSELLPVIDNLERALDMLDKSNSELIATIEGIELTLKSFLDVVSKFGLEVVNEINVPFNPKVHQAMVMLESDEYNPNLVMMIMQKGYTLHGRLIRPAMVTVSKSKI